jgi:hypothetical protein
MKRTLRRLGLSCIVGIGGVGVAILLLTRAFAAEKQPNVQPVDRPKGAIEMPTKRILARQTAPAPAASAGAFVNPKVQPGEVRWHRDFNAACAAARKSGKPVLLFQMMGKLDDRFC